MSFNVMHLGLVMLGAAGLALPVLAHLLSRKKYDVVNWGAMQFLDPGRNKRRRIRLEQFLLMLLRMAAIFLIAFALSRPWAEGGFLTNLISSQSRDVVLVVDGSYSMGWEGQATTPHAAANQWAHSFLEELNAGDTVAVLDARNLVRPVIESPTRDFDLVRQQLDALPPPAGTSDLAAASARAVSILSRTSNLARDVVILTDGQSVGWHADDIGTWTRFDTLREEPTVKPRVWVVDVSTNRAAKKTNFSVETLELSRELTVSGFPIRISTKVKYSGGEARVTRRVFFEVDGQRLENKTLTVQLEPEGEASVEFEHRFPATGSHVVSAVLEPDHLPGDNRADAAITVAQALPALIVDGDPQLDAARAESFFLSKALTARGNDTPWVQARTVPHDRFTAADLNEPEVVVLANVPKLNAAQTGALLDFVSGGGGLFIAAGDRCDADWYNTTLYGAGDEDRSGRSVLPAMLESIEQDEEAELQGVHVADDSLDLPWMQRFRAEHDGGFTEARWLQWWKIAPAVTQQSPEEKADDPPDTEDAADDDSAGPQASAVVTAARLDVGTPLLVTRGYGRGRVLLMAAPLDADWSTLPAKPDYVSFAHEMIFYLSAGRAPRNVPVGVPLVFPVADDFRADQHLFLGPGETEFEVKAAGDELHPLARLDDTRLPGVYRLVPKGQPAGAVAAVREYFVVNADRSESDLTALDDDQKHLLTTEDRMAFRDTVEELKAEMFTDSSRTELWKVILFVFIGLLVFEVIMTRRLVQGGHADIEPDGGMAEVDEADFLESEDSADSRSPKPSPRPVRTG